MKALLTAAALASVLAVGCSSDNEDRDDSREVEIDRRDVPSAVLRSFERKYPDATIRRVERETYKDGTVHYEISYKDADGKKKDVELDASGDVLEDHD
jgi:uncharacterized membrane protein YkoI